MTLPTREEIDSLCIQRISERRGVSFEAAKWQYNRMNSKRRRRLQGHIRSNLAPQPSPESSQEPSI